VLTVCQQVKLKIKIIIIVLAIWGRFPAKVGPGTLTNGPGLENAATSIEMIAATILLPFDSFIAVTNTRQAFTAFNIVFIVK
jgi:hypothetical protein